LFERTFPTSTVLRQKDIIFIQYKETLEFI
jgi:hypothetical protein